jgi:adenylate cyclase
MRFTRRQGLPALAGLLIVALALTARGLTPDFFERAQLLVFDSLQRAKPWEIITPQVRVVDIDDASLKRVGQWPWSRSILAKLVVALQDMQARSIAFDVVFAEPDRTSPARLVAEWRQSFAWRAPAGPESSLPDYDSDLAAAFARGRIATGFGLLAQANGAAPTIAASVATIGGDPALTVENFGGAVPNLKVLETSAAGNGSLSITAGRDQIVRALPLLSAFDGKLVPSLALEALRVAEDEDTIGVRAERNGGAAGPITGYTVRVGAFETPMNADGSLLLHHGALSADATI